MAKTPNPYSNLPITANWRRSVASIPFNQVDPVSNPDFTISPADKVATAGSCFAQHIARHLSQNGFNYFVTEKAHSLFPEHLATEFGYGIFSARYGNIYTPRQLLQLFQRVYGEFQPDEDHWLESDGSFVDPFRPSCNPGGFATLTELRIDQKQHFAAVRKMFEELDVFVFTLGLTECWASCSDGAIYPICPGTLAGTFDSQKYKFINLTVEEVVADLRVFLQKLRRINPKSRVILTVSPVPLAATAEPRHVLSSTTLSKSILRVAADVIAREEQAVAYFESYEVITGSFNRGQYFAEDLRSVREEGVQHVMRLFLSHYTLMDQTHGKAAPEAPTPANTDADFLAKMNDVIAVMCDEEKMVN